MAKHKAAAVPNKVQQQKEEKARIEAERLLTAKQSEKPENGSAQEEPSLFDRLADIDRRARERAADEKRQLAGQYLSEARAAFKRAISNTTDENLKTAFEDLQKLEKLVGDEGGSTSAPAAASDGAQRTRLGADKLTEIAKDVADWIKEKGEPVSGGDIKRYAAEKFNGYKIMQPLPFLDKYHKGHGIVTKGEKAAMRYQNR